MGHPRSAQTRTATGLEPLEMDNGPFSRPRRWGGLRRGDEPERLQPPIGFIRQRIESIVQTLKDQLRLEHHLARSPAGLYTRILARILALCAAIHLNWQTGQPARALAQYAH
jgi:hypothetical protein